jgi:hypothetical protein
LTNHEKFPVTDPNFSMRAVEQKLQEADSASSFPQFLRAGLQAFVNAMYEATQTTFEEWTTTVQSSKDEEIYAPNHGVAFPREIGRQEKYPEVGVAALDISLKNKKYGTMYAAESELISDDQTGTFSKQASLLGQYMRLVYEILVYGKFSSVANMQYQQLIIPVSETKPSLETDYPWSTALIGGGRTRPDSYGVLSPENLQKAVTALMVQKNLQGIIMEVSPDKLLVGPYYALTAATILNSEFYPAGAGAAGVMTGNMATNVLKGMFDLVVSRYMPTNLGAFDGSSKRWAIVDSKKPFFITQIREPVSVLQEADNAGRSFEEDVKRWKTWMRGNADFIDPRFSFMGSDGSI